MNLKNVLTYILVASVSATSFAGTYDKSTGDLLIQKFKKVLLQLAPGDQAREGVQLRLADLLSERARFLAMTEIEAGCVGVCNAGEKDRQEALKLYKAALKTIDPINSGRVLAQMGHLYEMMGEKSKAEKLYLDVLNKNVTEDIKAEAEFSLGEMYFKDRAYIKALAKYNSALKKESFQRKGQATYRKAWAYYNLGQPDVAIKIIKEILNSPELLTKSTVSGVVAVDPQFKSEVAQDLATFYSHFNAAKNEAEDVYKYSPDEAKLNNLQYLANELQRLGHINRSIIVYEFLYQLQSRPEDRLETNIHLSQMHLNQKDKEKSIELNTQALDLWQANGCQSEKCKELHSRLRKYVLSWHHEEKKVPSRELYKAYQRYINVFPKEVDMILWASDIAQMQRQWTEAHKLVSSALVALESFEAKNKPSKEGLLLRLIEIAEQSKDHQLHLASLTKYLVESLDKTKINEVDYQIAQWHYKKGDYKKSADLFYQLASSVSVKNKTLKKQAADLALDSLVLLKDALKIEKWSHEFAVLFATSKDEYVKIARTSQMNQIVSIASGEQNNANLEKAWNKLNDVSLDGATNEEFVTYYRNKILLGVKLKKLDAVMNAAQKLSKVKGIEPQDKELALSQMAWVAELKLDFKTAYDVTQKMILKELNPEQKILKLALLAELSGGDSGAHYAKYLQLVPNSEIDKKRAVALKVIENSKTPVKTLKKNRMYFKGAEATYAELLFKNTKESERTSLLKEQMVEDTYIGKLLWRQKFIAEFNKIKQKVAQHKIRTNSQKNMARDLKSRVSLLNKIEAKVNIAITKKDWVAQVLTLHCAGVEQKRFYNEIIALPVPEDLSSEEQQQYLTLLSQQAAPHLTKATEFESKEKEFWANNNIFEEYQKAMKNTSGDLFVLYKEDLKYLQSIAPETHQQLVVDTLNTQRTLEKRPLVSLSVAETVRNKVRQDPFNGQFLMELKTIEEQLGNRSMIAYLEQRIEKLGNGKTDKP